MNLGDLFLETFRDNHIDRICDGCLHAMLQQAGLWHRFGGIA